MKKKPNKKSAPANGASAMLPAAITYCSAANGKILDKLMPATSKKCSVYEKLLPDGGVEYCAMDRTSRYSIEELETILGQKYIDCNADDLAGILILKLVKELVNGCR